jgi:L-asparaginase
MRVHIITTGGTIDKIYFDAQSEFQVGAPQIGAVLQEANVTVDFRVRSLMRKDSLDLTDEDRLRIRQAIAETKGRAFVVTHGTDTMTQTAQALKGLPGRVIVLTGALQPAIFRRSDAIFNIACAFTAVQLLPEGVYIAMNGRIFDPERVRKNREQNRFEPLPDGTGPGAAGPRHTTDPGAE